MAHFAEIRDGRVARVIVIDNDDCGGGEFPDSEPVGQAYIAALGLPGEWRQTSYSDSFRGQYAGSGMLFDGDVFLAPPPPEPLPEV